MFQNKKEFLCTFCGCLVALIFILTIFSPENVDPLNTNWVTNGGGDNLQHYLGWRFYRNSSWNRYLFFMRDLNYPVGTSVIVTDSNPLFCFIFKIFRNVLPEAFQFNGIWIVLSYLLIGFFSVKISWELTGNFLLSLLSALIVVLNPVVLQRAIIHDTLAAHWIILFGIYLLLKDKSRWNPVAWFFITEAALLIHFYFIPMLAFLWVLQMIRMFIKKRPFMKLMMTFIVFPVSILLGYYAAGYTHIVPQSGSFGELSMNLNAFINPDSIPALLQPRPKISLQYEGFNYWGLGLILLFLFGLVLSRKTIFRKSFPYILPAAGLILLAASNIGYFDNRIVYQINLPEKILSTLSVFRSSGRLVWPLYYLVLFTVIYSLSRVMESSDRKRIITQGIVVICAVIQIYDLHEFHTQTSFRFRNPDNTLPLLPSAFTESIPEDIRHIYCSEGDSKMKDAIALFAAENQMTFNRSANARDIEHIYGGDMLDMETLTCEMTDADSIYVYLDPQRIPSGLENCAGVTVIRNDGWSMVRKEN